MKTSIKKRVFFCTARSKQHNCSGKKKKLRILHHKKTLNNNRKTSRIIVGKGVKIGIKAKNFNLYSKIAF